MSDDVDAAGPVHPEREPRTVGAFDLDDDLRDVDDVLGGEDAGSIERTSLDEVRAIEVPSSFEPQTWQRMLTVVSQHWDQAGRMPTPEAAHRLWKRIPVETYRLAFAEPEFQRALALRGVDFDPTDALSDEQYMAILKLTDPSDKRSERAKLNSMGISWPRYLGWLKNPVFARAKRDKTEEMFADVSDLALTRLRGNVDAGDQRAIEFSLAVTGRHNPANQAVQDARQIIMMVVESVVKNVESPEVREAILMDVKAASAGLAIADRRQALEN